ncbi:energy-coupled thiamine transporter ThiT [Enterococcus caccae]|uniref:Thiamin permease n=1 Tax=Enterococcus caccae ATCC BAA-1240 TaxID=1158612 RepID=R3TPF7_9ENTE|nr:energy-coupled thiamine transporter ThiT [Enterococcus caccae]EOL43409.1 thiamin permease [Enterococcus caccae ATCC BAA-1240]EOT68191.1 thiamin permease [Enterococcus caccae ATCC BAA-1240]OJG26945.1 thiamin permease [Enterococcus caccae]
MQRKVELQIWIEGTIVAAIAMVLSFIPTNIGSSFSISLGMIPVTLYALRRGTKAGFFSAFIWGLLHFPLAQVYYLMPAQVIIEYILAFGFAGFAGVYSNKLQQTIMDKEYRKSGRIILYASFLGTLMRYFWHFIAGVMFWGSFALWGMNPWLFSFVMNGASGLATAMATAIVLVLLLKINPKLFIPTHISKVSRQNQKVD